MGAEDLGDRVKIWVEDEGPGMPEEELSAVFKKFYRGAAAEKYGHADHHHVHITKPKREAVRFPQEDIFVG